MTGRPESGFETVSRARRAVHSAQRIVVLTGAGVSAESGVPTFRGKEGLWGERRPEEIATPEAFRSDPVTVWEWYAWRRRIISECVPNPAHRAIAALQSRREGVTVITQNVDGLHARAFVEADGAPDDGLDPTLGAGTLELHGSLFRARCTECHRGAPHSDPVNISSSETLPRCPDCGGLLRPDVVWFGEALDEAVLGRAFEAARASDVCLVVGTSAVVQPAASIPLATLASGGDVIEVNVTDTPITAKAIASVRGPAGRVLPLLLDGPDTRVDGP